MFIYTINLQRNEFWFVNSKENEPEAEALVAIILLEGTNS